MDYVARDRSRVIRKTAAFDLIQKSEKHLGITA